MVHLKKRKHTWAILAIAAIGIVGLSYNAINYFSTVQGASSDEAVAKGIEIQQSPICYAIGQEGGASYSGDSISGSEATGIATAGEPGLEHDEILSLADNNKVRISNMELKKLDGYAIYTITMANNTQRQMELDSANIEFFNTDNKTGGARLRPLMNARIYIDESCQTPLNTANLTEESKTLLAPGSSCTWYLKILRNSKSNPSEPQTGAFNATVSPKWIASRTEEERQRPHFPEEEPEVKIPEEKQ